MNDSDIKKIQTLMEEEKYEDAGKILTEMFRMPWDSGDRASFYLQFSSLYFEILRKINEKYRSDLESILHGVEGLHAPRKAQRSTEV